MYSKGLPFDGKDSRMFPVLHIFVSHLNFEHLFKNICRLETKLDQK